MKPALYVLGGIAAAFAFAGLSILSVELSNWLFGKYGLLVWAGVLMTLGGGLYGWLFYRLRGGK